MSNRDELCMPASPPTATSDRPDRANLDYSFGLPGGAYCLGTARTAVGRVLAQHGLGDMAELGVLAASELLSNAVVFTPGRAVSLALRWRFGVLRLTVFDEHPEHADSVEIVCRAHRREALSTLQAVVDECGGVVGLAAAEKPLAGSKLWVAMPRVAGRHYAEL
ncbi:ATP-binding protein [Streptomyces triculaminicus]|uniref:ATP-binding protein n=1 Tax=Streptomyces triculaminicus TaxID=2816232 RepID=A0A939JLT1_9ACTN|nr:ATP-binding protein [Streptomyces triculaminicus]MBO0651628.1 ATP-binding protein [Streptomyces triculaminicus]